MISGLNCGHNIRVPYLYFIFLIDIIKIYSRFKIYWINTLTLSICSEFNIYFSGEKQYKVLPSEKKKKYKAINILFCFILLHIFQSRPYLYTYIHIHMIRVYVELFTRCVVYILFRLFPLRVLVHRTWQSISPRVFYFSLVTHFSIISVLRAARIPFPIRLS